jgi:Fanconi anemia group M protein|tara:strand:- start:555 stop:1187 length:633 start_codon:yes stop_codon:yes gene_type:complete
MIIIDTRKENKVIDFLTQENLEFKEEKLEIGDLLFVEKNIIIERKNISDFAGSVKNHKVFVQAQNMVNNYKHCYVIIIGSLKDLYFKKVPFSVNQFYGAIARLSSIGVRILQVKNINQYITLSLALNEKLDDNKEIIKLKKLGSKENTNISILRALPNISTTKAEQILENGFKIKLAILNKDQEIVSINKLKNIDGFGKKTIYTLEPYFL